MAEQYQFKAGDLKTLLANAADADNVIISVEYEVLPGSERTFKATVLAQLSGSAVGDPGQTTGCPIPPGCP